MVPKGTEHFHFGYWTGTGPDKELITQTYPGRVYNNQVLYFTENRVVTVVPTFDVYVDANRGGAERGTEARPFDTLTEGLAETEAMDQLSRIFIKGANYNEGAMTINQPVRLVNNGGDIVRITGQ